MNEIILGDCLDVMRTMEGNSVDCVVTDPPYGLGFMGNAWDTFDPKYLKQDPLYIAENAGTYNQSVKANRQFQSWCAAWSAETFRIAKPGAFQLVFGGTRTFHRMTAGIEDAGWEIRDCMMWLYGSGFPKSFNVSKGIDKASGHGHSGLYNNGRKRNAKCETCGKWFMSGSPCVCPRTNEELNTDAAKQWSGWGTALKPAWEPIIVARKPLEGTVAENVLKWGTGAMNIDGGRIGTETITAHGGGKNGDGRKYGGGNGIPAIEAGSNPHQGRWPANVILDEEAGAMLDGQTNGVIHSAGSVRGKGQAIQTNDGAMFGIGNHEGNGKRFGDTGGASRFFYCAKASKRERGEDNNHPTVKPISLLQYLVKLVCPPNGIVLDPFAGSGSTGLAAQALGFNFIGIEKEKAYVEIANKRMVGNPVMAA